MTGNASIGGNLMVTWSAIFTGTVSGIPVGSATQPALDLKAHVVDVYTKTDMDMSLSFKANTLSPIFTGNVTTPSLTVNIDTTLSGNRYVIGTDKVITAKNQAAPSSNLSLSGVVSLDNVLNAPSGATLGNATFSGTVTGLTKPKVNLGNVDNTTDAIRQRRHADRFKQKGEYDLRSVSFEKI